MLAVFPLWTGFQGYANITFSKFMFFAVTGGLWLLWITAAAFYRRERPTISKCGWAVLALMGIACLSAVFSPYGADVIIGAGRYDGLVSLLLYGCIFLGVSAYARPKPGYSAALAFSVSVCCVVSLFQLLGQNPLSLFPGSLNYFDHGIKYSSEFLGNIGNVDVFAALLCVAVPIFFGEYLCREGKKYALFLLPAVLGEFVALESGVASAKLGLAASLVISVIVLANRKRLKKLAVVILAAALAAGLSGAVHFTAGGVVFGKAEVQAADSAPSAQTSTMSEIKEMLHGHFEDSYGSGRIGIWRQCLEVYPQHAIIGGGPGTVADRIEINYSRYVSQTGRTLKTSVDNAHNEYLGYLMDEGIAGLGAYLAMAVMTLIIWIKRRSEPVAALGCGMIGYWVQSFFGIGLCLVLPVIWLIWGLMWPAESKKETPDDKRNLRRADKRHPGKS